MLWDEGKAALEQLLKFMVHPAISSINLTAALGSLATIARQRPMFMAEVIQAYETLHGKPCPSGKPRPSLELNWCPGSQPEPGKVKPRLLVFLLPSPPRARLGTQESGLPTS